MLTISDQVIGSWVGSFMWPFIRITTFLMMVPVFGTQLVPPRTRLILSVFITLIVMPSLPAVPLVDAISLKSIVLIAQQILIGAALAFCLQLLFQIFILAGQIMAMQMGLGFASMMDPINGISVVVLSQFYLMLVMLVFLAMNGHLMMIDVLIESFKALPIAESGLGATDIYGLVAQGSWLLASGLLISLPAVTASLVVNLAFGVMTRAAPQLNIMSIGFPVMVGFGLFIVWISLTGFLPQYHHMAGQAFELMHALLKI
jgi:flagellar biosynthetic protein FliR